MLRLVLFLILSYLIWKVVSIVVRVLLGPPRSAVPRQKPPSPPPARSQEPRFRDIKDADFEDITPPRS